MVATVAIMGAATTLIGCLPTYQQAGLVGPVLMALLRLVQGLAIGEYTPAVPMQCACPASPALLRLAGSTRMQQGTVRPRGRMPAQAQIQPKRPPPATPQAASLAAPSPIWWRRRPTPPAALAVARGLLGRWAALPLA